MKGFDGMDIDKVYNNDEQEWQWCLVGNIVEEHEYGEEHTIKSGTKHFPPNTKVYINMVYGGMGYEDILVIGMPRHSQKYIEIVIARKYVSNFRMQKVYKPAVLNRMKNSEWAWWGDTEESRNKIMGFLEWLNPEEAAKERNKLLYSGMRGKILRSIEQKISEWQEDDIYAISLYVFNEEDDPCRPVAVLGYNTERKMQKSTPEASDQQEARWNYAFWLQNEEMCWGRGDTAEDIKEWITEQNLLEREDEITEKFVDLLVAVVQDIHASGMLKDKFGREIPILIHGLEYYEKIAQQNIEANGEALDRDFISFCMPYIPEVQDEMLVSQNEVPKAEKRITIPQSQRIQGSSVIGKKSVDMRIVMVFIVFVVLIMFSFWVLGLIISSRNASVSEDLPQQTVDFGEENEESISQPEEKEHLGQTTFDAVPYFDEDTNGMLQYADGTKASLYRMNYDGSGFSSYTEMIGWEENGAFLIQRKGIESPVQLVFVDWEGKEALLVSFQQQPGRDQGNCERPYTCGGAIQQGRAVGGRAGTGPFLFDGGGIGYTL